MLDLGFPQISQNISFFDNFFLIAVSKGGPKEKTLKKQCIALAIFQHFSCGPTLGNYVKMLSIIAEIF
jgi:hypothetical protein